MTKKKHPEKRDTKHIRNLSSTGMRKSLQKECEDAIIILHQIKGLKRGENALPKKQSKCKAYGLRLKL